MRAVHLKSQWRSMAAARAERQKRIANRNNGASSEIAGGLKRRFSLFFPERRSFDQPSAGTDTASGPLSSKMTAKYLHRIRLVIPHILLYMATILYSIFGAIVFHLLELPFETEHLQKHSLAIIEAQDSLINIESVDNMPILSNALLPGYTPAKFSQPSYAQNSTFADQLLLVAHNESINNAIDILIRVSMDAFAEGIRASDLTLLRNSSDHHYLVISKWNFHSALFFTTTLLTSIGYGNLVPISPFGRIFCICYAFLGIPLTLITIADVAKFFADLLMNAADKWKRSQRETTIFGFGSSSSSSARSQLANNVGQSYKEESDRQEENARDDVGMLAQPGFWTKTFVLSLLFFYMTTMALIFSIVQENWNFLDSFYFCLITLVTIGFGDFCPVEEDHYGGWIIFIFAGLILSTLTVDLVGSAYIERIHTLGRGFDLGSFLNMLGKGNTASLLQQLYAGSYQPEDLKFIPYIDQVNNNYLHNNSAASSLAMMTVGKKKQSFSMETCQQQMHQRQFRKTSGFKSKASIA